MKKLIKFSAKERLFTAFLFIFTIFLTPTLFAQNGGQVENFDVLRQSVLDYVNQYRKEKRLPPMQTVALIAAEAIRHSQNMANGSVDFGHFGFKERSGRIMNQIINSDAVAENVAFGNFTAQEVVTRWLQSPGHRKNIEGHYNLTGIGIARGQNGFLYFTQIFINRRN